MVMRGQQRPSFDAEPVGRSDSTLDSAEYQDPEWQPMKESALQVAALVISISAFVGTIALLTSSSRNAIINQDMSWSTLFYTNRTIELGLQGYAVTDTVSDVTLPNRYEAQATCEAFIQDDSSVDVCYECEQSGDGITSLISFGVVANGMTVILLAMSFHTLNHNYRTFQYATLTSGVCLISTFISLLWWYSICHLELPESAREYHSGFFLCAVLIVFHFTMILLCWYKASALVREERQKAQDSGATRDGGGPYEGSDSGYPDEYEQRWEITGDISVDEVDPGYYRTVSRDRSLYQTYSPSSGSSPESGAIALSRYALYWPHRCSNGNHHYYVAIGAILAVVSAILGTLILFATSSSFRVVEAMNFGAISIKRTAGTDTAMIYVGYGTMGYDMNGETSVQRFPDDADFCEVIRTETSASLDQYNCVNAVGCAVCTDVVQWITAFLSVAYIALLINCFSAISRVLSSNSGWSRAFSTISTATALLMYLPSIFMVEYDCLRMLMEPVGCEASDPAVEHGAAFVMACIVVVLLTAEFLIQFLTGHIVIEVPPRAQAQRYDVGETHI